MGMLSLLLFGMISWYTYIILNQLIMESNKRSYANVCAYYLGKVGLGTDLASSQDHHPLYDFLHHVFRNFVRFGLYARDLNIAWQFLCVILKNYNIVPFVYKNEVNQEIDQNDPLTVKWRYICNAAMGVAIIPLVYQRTLGSLRYFSMYTFIAMCSTIVVRRTSHSDHSDGVPGVFQQSQGHRSVSR